MCSGGALITCRPTLIFLRKRRPFFNKKKRVRLTHVSIVEMGNITSYLALYYFHQFGSKFQLPNDLDRYRHNILPMFVWRNKS